MLWLCDFARSELCNTPDTMSSSVRSCFFTVSLGNIIGSVLIRCFCRNVPEPELHWPNDNSSVMAKYSMFTGLDLINKSLVLLCAAGNVHIIKVMNPMPFPISELHNYDTLAKTINCLMSKLPRKLTIWMTLCTLLHKNQVSDFITTRTLDPSSAGLILDIHDAFRCLSSAQCYVGHQSICRNSAVG